MSYCLPKKHKSKKIDLENINKQDNEKEEIKKNNLNENNINTGIDNIKPITDKKSTKKDDDETSFSVM